MGGILTTFSQPISQLRNEGMALRNECTMLQNGTRVPRGGFAAAKIFAKGDRRLRNHFAAGGDFRSGCLGAAKLFRNQGPFSQGPFLGYEISQIMFSSCF